MKIVILDFLIYFFREEKGRRKRVRETSMCGCLSHAPYWGPGLQPRPVLYTGNLRATLCFTGRHSIHLATPVRAIILDFDRISRHSENVKVTNKRINIESLTSKSIKENEREKTETNF